MKTSRRRSLLIAGAVAALVASGGVAAAASGHDSAPKDTGITLTEVPGNPEPQDVQPGTAVPATDIPIVIGDEGVTQAR
jgi:hypothetical protein